MHTVLACCANSIRTWHQLALCHLFAFAFARHTGDDDDKHNASSVSEESFSNSEDNRTDADDYEQELIGNESSDEDANEDDKDAIVEDGDAGDDGDASSFKDSDSNDGDDDGDDGDATSNQGSDSNDGDEVGRDDAEVVAEGQNGAPVIGKRERKQTKPYKPNESETGPKGNVGFVFCAVCVCVCVCVQLIGSNDWLCVCFACLYVCAEGEDKPKKKGWFWN